MVRGRWAIVAAMLVVLVLLVGGAIAIIRQEAARKAPQAPRAAQPAPAPAEVTLPVHIRAQQTVAVSAQISGRIEEFRTEVGEEVFEGQVLARLSNVDMQNSRDNAAAALENAQARVSKLEAAVVAGRLEASRARADAQRTRTEMERTDKIWQRQKMLYREGATPRLVYEKAEKEALSTKGEHDAVDALARQAEERVGAVLADLENAKKLEADKSRELEDAQAHLKAADVVSPVNGVVVARRGEVGEPVGEDGNMEVFQVALNTALLEAVLDLDPSALARLTPGHQAMLFFADIPGEGVAGTVAEIRNNQARITFTSPTPLIKPGMTAQVRITLR